VGRSRRKGKFPGLDCAEAYDAVVAAESARAISAVAVAAEGPAAHRGLTVRCGPYEARFGRAVSGVSTAEAGEKEIDIGDAETVVSSFGGRVRKTDRSDWGVSADLALRADMTSGLSVREDSTSCGEEMEALPPDRGEGERFPPENNKVSEGRFMRKARGDAFGEEEGEPSDGVVGVGKEREGNAFFGETGITGEPVTGKVTPPRAGISFVGTLMCSGALCAGLGDDTSFILMGLPRGDWKEGASDGVVGPMDKESELVDGAMPWETVSGKVLRELFDMIEPEIPDSSSLRTVGSRDIWPDAGLLGCASATAGEAGCSW
jgi:hypothetical protein